jgi:hypothetical protein
MLCMLAFTIIIIAVQTAASRFTPLVAAILFRDTSVSVVAGAVVGGSGGVAVGKWHYWIAEISAVRTV